MIGLVNTQQRSEAPRNTLGMQRRQIFLPTLHTSWRIKELEMPRKSWKLETFLAMNVKSGWPSGLRRQTQEIYSSLESSEHSGPRMWAWVRIPLLMIFFFKITKNNNNFLIFVKRIYLFPIQMWYYNLTKETTIYMALHVCWPRSSSENYIGILSQRGGTNYIII